MIRTVERKRERETARRSSYKSQQRHSTRHCMAWVESISGREGAATARSATRTHSERKHKTRRSEAQRETRAAEGERRHSRSSGHPATGFSGRSDPPHQQVETRRTGGQVVRDLERRRPGEPVGVGVGTFATNPGGDRENRWAWWSILDTFPPTRAGGDRENRWVRGSGPSAGGLAIDTRSLVWMINLPFQ
jgi:hypothetical protein